MAGNRDMQAAAALTFNNLARRYGSNIFLVQTAGGHFGYAAFQKIPWTRGLLSVAYIRGTGVQDDPLLPADARGEHVVQVTESQIKIHRANALPNDPVEGEKLANLIKTLGDEIEEGGFFFIWTENFAVANKWLMATLPQQMTKRGMSS